MAMQSLIFLPCFLFSSSFLLLGALGSETDKAAAAVEGMVYCQSCSASGGHSLTGGARPLPAARVAVACKDHKNDVMYYETFTSDAGGYFYAPLSGMEMAKGYYINYPLHGCTVRLISSPDERCDVLTDINKGIEGAPLRDSNKVVGETTVYSTGPLAFRPAICGPKTQY